MKQCKACPWKVSTVPSRDIPNGYCAAKHATLRRTIAEDPLYAGTTMACHETPAGRERPCVGWVEHQRGPGNNMKLRFQARDGRFADYRTEGEQHQTFEATLGDVKLSRQRAWQLRKRALGLCASCGAPGDGGSLCSTCRIKSREKNRAPAKDRTDEYARARSVRLGVRAVQCFKRRCSVCKRLGHNRRTCPQGFPQPVEK